MFSHSFLCLRKEKKHNSPFSAINDAVESSQDPSSSELLGLCSGKFETQPFSQHGRYPSDHGASQGVRELLGLPASAKPKPVGISNLLQSRSGMDLNVEESQNSEMSEVIGLCSGVFPTARQPKSQGAGPRTQQSAGGTSDGMSGSSGSGEESEGENLLLRWVQRQKAGSKPRERAAARATGAGSLSDSEDEDMPVLTRKRRKKPRVIPKPSKE